jgi:hypothetical protein
MRETVRHYYLSALGIDSYFPRWQLPSSPESAQCELPSEYDYLDDTDTDTALVDYSSTPPNALSQVVDSLLMDISARVGPTQVVVESLKSSQDCISPATSSDLLSPFSLTIFRPIQNILIIDLRSAVYKNQTHRLLHNILFAYTGNTAPFSFEVVRWPAIENEFLPNTLEWAMAELQTWLQVEYEQRQFDQLWLMGQQLRDYFLDRECKASEVDACMLTVQFPFSLGNMINVKLTPTLADLLERPDLKAQLWTLLCD